MTDVFDPEKRSWLMGRIGSKNTKPEMRVRKAAHALGLRYRLHGKTLPGKPDIVLAGRGIVVFVHGCFWHRHDGCKLASTPGSNAEFWREKFARNVERDRRNIELLQASAWNPVVIWECETRRPEQLEAIICERVMSRERVVRRPLRVKESSRLRDPAEVPNL